MQKEFPVVLSVLSFVSFLTKVMSERTISLGVRYDGVLPRHCGDGVEVCAQLTVFSVGGERLSG